jgi:hypothetical protein
MSFQLNRVATDLCRVHPYDPVILVILIMGVYPYTGDEADMFIG